MKQQPGTLAAVLLLCLGFFVRAAAQDTAADLCASGDDKAAKGDEDGAIADYTRAIALDPKNADAYNSRSIAKQYKGDADGAIADATSVIALDPKNADAFYNRGIAREYKGDLDAAIADLSRAIELDPENAEPYPFRANAKQEKGDTGGALADFNRAIEMDAKDPDHYMARGVEQFRLRKWPAAIADFRRCCQLSAESDALVYQDYASIYLWLTRARISEAKAASMDLLAYMDKRPATYRGDWLSKVADFLTGGITEDQLLAAAAVPDTGKAPDPDQQCEAWFYAGMKKLLAADNKAAAADFRKCLATGRRACEEYLMAESELTDLGENTP